MYLLGKSLWGAWGGFISALFYVYAPYRAMDMYVRGAVGEFWAMGFMPFVFWSTFKVAKGEKKAVLWLALSLAGLFTSHNISTLIFVPLFFLWAGFLLIIHKTLTPPVLKARFKNLLLSFSWGFSISAFFLLPAWFERKLVHVETLTQGYFNYLAHFVSVGQTLFKTYWGYGTSEIGPYDDISFSVGLLHWILPILALLLLYLSKKKKELRLVLFFVIFGWASLFLTHSRSSFIWNNINILSFLQFPWRFLMLVVFSFSTAAGSIAILFNRNKKFRIWSIITISVLSLFFYSPQFRPKAWLDITDEQKFSGEEWQKQLTISIFDYLPIYAQFPPTEKAPDKPQVVDGSMDVVEGKKGTNWQIWELEVYENSIVELSLYYFPGWKVFVDDEEVSIDYENELGLIRFEMTKGTHKVKAKLTNTPIRSIGNVVSLVGLLAIPLYWRERKKK